MLKNNNIVIINYLMGNLRSIQNKFKRIGIECNISNNLNEIEMADKIILPGVGHFKKGMENLKSLKLIDIINKKVLIEKIPILGICLGAQLFCKYSEEGNSEGLGWLDAEVIHFRVSDKIRFKVPHMGWNNVKIINSNFLNQGLSEKDQFYFVHSYHFQCNDPSIIWMKTVYEYEFVSALHKGNIYGVQFHPEKSHDAGYELLKRFVEL